MENRAYGFKNLKVYNDSVDLVIIIYEILKTFPKSEDRNIISQMKRSSSSISANIAEGHAFQDYIDKEILHLNYAKGSANETLHWLYQSYCLSYIDSDTYLELEYLTIEVLKMLSGLITSKKYKKR